MRTSKDKSLCKRLCFWLVMFLLIVVAFDTPIPNNVVAILTVAQRHAKFFGAPVAYHGS